MLFISPVLCSGEQKVGWIFSPLIRVENFSSAGVTCWETLFHSTEAHATDLY